jgi:hypothetical protein
VLISLFYAAIVKPKFITHELSPVHGLTLSLSPPEATFHPGLPLVWIRIYCSPLGTLLMDSNGLPLSAPAYPLTSYREKECTAIINSQENKYEQIHVLCRQNGSFKSTTQGTNGCMYSVHSPSHTTSMSTFNGTTLVGKKATPKLQMPRDGYPMYQLHTTHHKLCLLPYSPHPP